MILNIINGNINIHKMNNKINNKYTHIGYVLILVFNINDFKG
jgi:hypothetical protein